MTDTQGSDQDAGEARPGGNEPVAIRPAAVALHASDLRERWSAQAAELLANSLSAERILFTRVNARGERDGDVVLLDRSSRVRSAGSALADYHDRFDEGGPFLPLQHADTIDRVEHGWPPTSDGAGRAAFARLCWRWGIVDALTLYLADAGRVVGYFVALRMTRQPPFAPADLHMARTAQGLLATSYAAVLRATPRETSTDSAVLEAAGLSPRETEVARLLAQGATNKQIAAAMSRSPATVNTHVTRVLAKLGLGNRAQVAWILGVTSER